MIAYLILTTAIAAIHFAIRRHETGIIRFPDGERYLRAGRGQRLHRPFHLRWLMPFLLRGNESAWRATNAVATIALAPLMMLFLMSAGLDLERAFIGSLLVPGLPGIFKMSVIGAYLIDAANLALILLAATLFNVGQPLLGLSVAIIGACVKESSPVFVALLGQSPWALLAFAPVAIRQVTYRSNPADCFSTAERDILRHPFKAGRDFHRSTWLDPFVMVIPWGVVALGFAGLPWWGIATVVVAYAQLLVATDSVRLYQYAAPAMIYGAMIVMPLEFAGLLVVVQWVLPERYFV